MSKLLSAFRTEIKKTKDKGNNDAIGDVMYSTGFLNLDYLNGTRIYVKSNKLDFNYPSIGIMDGTAVQLIGRTHCGKTTIAVQMAANIIRPFKTSLIFHDDIEGGCNSRRYEVLTRFTQQELKEKYVYRNNGITLENFFNRIKTIRDLKVADPESYMYDTGLYDFKGERIFKYEPTVYIVDSIPMLMPEDVLEKDELSGQMTATSMAKGNTMVFKRITQLCKEANIILITINHILQDVQINPMMHKKATIPGLKQGERLPGGLAAQYLAGTLIRVDVGSKLKPEETFGISGFIGELQVIKSRTNIAMRSVPVIFNQATGFDNELSLFQLLKNNNKINGAGSHLYLGNREDIKFSMKTFKQTLKEYPDLRKVLAMEALPILEGLLSNTDEYGYMDDMEDNADINSLIVGLSSGTVSIDDSVNIAKDIGKAKPSKKKESIADILGGDLNTTLDEDDSFDED